MLTLMNRIYKLVSCIAYEVIRMIETYNPIIKRGYRVIALDRFIKIFTEWHVAKIDKNHKKILLDGFLKIGDYNIPYLPVSAFIRQVQEGDIIEIKSGNNCIYLQFLGMENWKLKFRHINREDLIRSLSI